MHEISTVNETSTVENLVILQFLFIVVKVLRMLEFPRFIDIEELLSNKLKQAVSVNKRNKNKNAHTYIVITIQKDQKRATSRRHHQEPDISKTIRL